MSRASRRPPPRPPARAPSARRPRGARSLRTLAVLALFVVALVVWQALATRGWQPAQATLGEIETQVTPAVDLRRLHVRLGRRRHASYTYRYQVGARSYEGREEGAPPASRLTVYYDPADPARSQVGPPRTGMALALSGTSLALLAAISWLARRRARARKPGWGAVPAASADARRALGDQMMHDGRLVSGVEGARLPEEV